MISPNIDILLKLHPVKMFTMIGQVICSYSTQHERLGNTNCHHKHSLDVDQVRQSFESSFQIPQLENKFQGIEQLILDIK